MAKQNLGMVTAYAYAVVGGYEGTEAEFEALLGNIATDLEEIENLTVIATTLPAGSAATASYDHGVLTLGIPKGDKGDTGAGATVAAGTTTTGAPGTNASVVNAGTAKDAVFNFTIPRGNTGNGIESIYLTGTSGAVKTYTILFTDGNTTTFDVTDGEVTNDALTAILADYAKTDGAYESMTVGNAEQLISSVYVTDEEPYQFRTSGGSADIGDREFDTLVGGSVAWNQLCASVSESRTAIGLTFTNNGNGSVTIVGTATTTTTFRLQANTNIIPTVDNHVYYVSVGGTLPTHGFVAMGRINGPWEQTAFIKKPDTSILEDSYFGLSVEQGSVINATFTPQVIDLTQLFGSTIADYIYTLEQGQAGAGVAFFRKYFPKPYNPYDAGTIKSVEGVSAHKTVGFNAWDEEWELGYYDSATGQKGASTTQIRSKNPIPALPNTTYCITKPVTTFRIVEFDGDGNFIRAFNTAYKTETFVTSTNCCYIAFNSFTSSSYGTTYNHDICINLSWDGERNGEYESYVEHSYPLDDSLTLRGIPKVANGKLYYDGDTYESDGTVTRKFGTITFDGTEDWKASSNANRYYLDLSVATFDYKNAPAIANNYIFNPIVSGSNNLGNKEFMLWSTTAQYREIIFRDDSIADVSAWKAKLTATPITVIYPLSTPTTETADTFVNPQIVDDFGTEEYITTSIVPVGHSTKYTNNLKAKLEMSPESPSGDGDYIVRQTSGTNEYVPLGSTTTINSIIARLEALENA